MNQNIIMEEDAKTIVSRVNLSELAGKEILITGATGLLGTYFLYTIKACRESGIPVKKVHILFARISQNVRILFMQLDTDSQQSL